MGWHAWQHVACVVSGYVLIKVNNDAQLQLSIDRGFREDSGGTTKRQRVAAAGTAAAAEAETTAATATPAQTAAVNVASQKPVDPLALHR